MKQLRTGFYIELTLQGLVGASASVSVRKLDSDLLIPFLEDEGDILSVCGVCQAGQMP